MTIDATGATASAFSDRGRRSGPLAAERPSAIDPQKMTTYLGASALERVKGIEPSLEAWEASVLPLNYTRVAMNLNALRPGGKPLLGGRERAPKCGA